MLDVVDVLEIIRGIVARKRASRREPVFALWSEIWQEYVAAVGTGNINDQLASMVRRGTVIEHRTAKDKSFELIEDASKTGE